LKVNTDGTMNVIKNASEAEFTSGAIGDSYLFCVTWIKTN
jgi:hypothetical protein